VYGGRENKFYPRPRTTGSRELIQMMNAKPRWAKASLPQYIRVVLHEAALSAQAERRWTRFELEGGAPRKMCVTGSCSRETTSISLAIPDGASVSTKIWHVVGVSLLGRRERGWSVIKHVIPKRSLRQLKPGIGRVHWGVGELLSRVGGRREMAWEACGYTAPRRLRRRYVRL